MRLPNSKKPDFSRAYSKANEILVKSSAIQTFPFSPKDLVKEQTPIVCRSFKKARKYGVDITAFGSESAIIMSFQGKKIIFYDETKPDTHNRFSILHELGHEINGHDFSKKDEDTYHRYEVETNYFAAQLLMPEQILRECQNRGARINRFFLQTNFGVSAQAADKRIETLARTNVEWRSRAEKEFDDIHIWEGYFDDIFDSPSLDGKGWKGFTRDYHQLEGVFSENGGVYEINPTEYLEDLMLYKEKTFEFDETKEVFNLIKSLLERAIKEGVTVKAQKV